MCLLEWLKLKSLTIPSVVEDVKETELPHTSGWNIKRYNHFGKELGSFL